MHKQPMFVLTAAVLLTAVTLIAIYNTMAVNAQVNVTATGGSNIAKSNMTNATSGPAKSMTQAAKASAARREGPPQQ